MIKKCAVLGNIYLPSSLYLRKFLKRFLIYLIKQEKIKEFMFYDRNPFSLECKKALLSIKKIYGDIKCILVNDEIMHDEDKKYYDEVISIDKKCRDVYSYIIDSVDLMIFSYCNNEEKQKMKYIDTFSEKEVEKAYNYALSKNKKLIRLYDFVYNFDI